VWCGLNGRTEAVTERPAARSPSPVRPRATSAGCVDSSRHSRHQSTHPTGPGAGVSTCPDMTGMNRHTPHPLPSGPGGRTPGPTPRTRPANRTKRGTEARFTRLVPAGPAQESPRRTSRTKRPARRASHPGPPADPDPSRARTHPVAARRSAHTTHRHHRPRAERAGPPRHARARTTRRRPRHRPQPRPGTDTRRPARGRTTRRRAARIRSARRPPNATAYSYASAVSGLSRAARRAGTIAARIPARTATTASTTIVPVGTT